MPPSSSATPAPCASIWTAHSARAAAQDWPRAALYVIATPIGNLADLSLRAWQALRCCDVIAAEDTRVARNLLQAWDVRTPLIAAHRHNEAQAAQTILHHLQDGARVGLITDAGSPAVSDPGGRIVAAVRAHYRVIPVPGASAVVTALMASGATSDANPAFAFAGFAPTKAAARQAWLRSWCALSAPVVLYEAPHRLSALLDDLAHVCAGERLLTIARELTKRFEQIVTLPLAQAPAWLAQDARHAQGEFVLIVHAAARAAQAEVAADLPPETLELLAALRATLSVRDAARVAARATGLPRDVLYQAALQSR